MKNGPLCLLVGLGLLWPRPAPAEVVINELHYNPYPENEAVEFVELYHAGEEPADLSGWRFVEGFDYTFPAGSSLAPGAYLVLAQNAAQYNKKFGSIFVGGAKAAGEFVSGKLSDSGEAITLIDSSGSVVDTVDYRDHFPWPTQAGGDGPSMELIHPALDNDLGGSWRSSVEPTPGERNSVFSEAAPPQVRQVSHLPEAPLPGEEVVVTAKVTDPEGVASVRLAYQWVLPGNYIALEDAAYETDWTELPMADDGVAPDEIAGDAIFTAALGGALQKHRHLMRYRIIAEDTGGETVQAPYLDDFQPNFAYFTYGDMPAWRGAVRPGQTEEVTFPPELLQTVPVYHFLTKKEDHADALFVPDASGGSGYGGSDYLWMGTLVYDGDVYDHIRYRARGGVWRYAMGKNMWKFLFNRGREFEARDPLGNPYPTKWKRLNFSAIIQQGNFGHRGEQGLFESVGFELFNKAGVPAPQTHFVHFRVIENAPEENLFGNQYGTDFQGLYLAIEQIDSRFLRSRDLPEGNVYKMEGGTGIRGLDGELKNLGPYPSVADYTDLEAFTNNGYERRDKDAAWWQTNFNVRSYYGYQSIVEYIHHYDVGAGKNYYYYHNPDSGQWTILPWDLDLTWDDGMYATPSPHMFNSTLLGIDELYIDYQNRLVEIGDLLFNEEQTGMLIDEKASAVYTPGELSLVDADRVMWDYNPIMTSRYVNPTKSGAGRFYQIAATKDFAGMIARMKAYIPHRRTFAERQLIDEGKMPAAPSLTYLGADSYPVDDLRFECTAFRGGSIFSPQAFAAMKWRVAAVTDPADPDWTAAPPNLYEIDAVWESEELTTFEPTVQMPVEVIRPGTTYRVRARMKNDEGYWGHWSDPVQFVATEPNLDIYRNGLVISEMLYAPAPAGEAEREAGFETEDFEYIELFNAGDVALDLSEIRFTKGIDYAFRDASRTTLAPGEFILIVRNEAAFAFRFGGELPVVGIYGEEDGGNRLDNNGERVKLSFGAGIGIREFDYDASTGWPEAQAGESLVLLLGSDGVPDHGSSANWHLSAAPGGTPGATSGQPEPHLTYAAWKAMAFPVEQLGEEAIVAPTVDPDGDGWINLHEYALAGNPLEADAPGPTIVIDDDDGGPVFVYRRPADTADLRYALEFSESLSEWDSVVDHPDAATESAVVETAQGVEEVRFALDLPGDVYWRLAVTLSE